MSELLIHLQNDDIQHLNQHIDHFLKTHQQSQSFGKESHQLFVSMINKFSILIKTDHVRHQLNFEHNQLQYNILQCLRILTRSKELCEHLSNLEFEKLNDLFPLITKQETQYTEIMLIQLLSILKRIMFNNNNLTKQYKSITPIIDLINYQSQQIISVLLDLIKLILEIDSQLIVQPFSQLYYLGKLLIYLEVEWDDVKILTANLLAKLLEFDQITINFKKLNGIGTIITQLKNKENAKLNVRIPILNVILKISEDQKNYQDIKMFDVIENLLGDLENQNYLIITSVVNIFGQLAFDEELANKIIQKSLKQILHLLFICHPHNHKFLQFIDIKKNDYQIATKELQLYIFRLLRYLGSIMRNRNLFKQLFIPRMLQIFIDIGNYNKALNAYKKIVEEFNKIEPEDVLCMEETLKQYLSQKSTNEQISKINDYEIIEQIGKGAFGSVYLCNYGNNIFALKQINGVSSTNYREVNIHSELDHPNIVKLYECFVYDNSLCLVMEFLDGFNLSELIKMKAEKGQYFEEEQIWKITVDLVSVLRYLHNEKQIVHRDLNPANLMIDSQYFLKVCDFGLAKHFSEDIVNNSFVGTLIYTCPQIVENKQYSEKADIWALGCILYELMQLKPAFSSPNPLILANKIVQLDYEQIINPNQIYSQELIELVQYCLVKDEDQRPNIQQILQRISSRSMIMYDQLKLEQQKLKDQVSEMRVLLQQKIEDKQ